MKVILYMATTVNGMIAEVDDSADFLTSTESQSYVAKVKEVGSLVIGRRTYEVLSKQPEFQEFVQNNVKIVAVSHSDFETKNDHRVAHSPQEALEILKDSSEVVVAGGGKLNAAFLKENLVDELFIDIEPALLGKGIPLFDGQEFKTQLEFVGSKHLSENEIQLHYKVVK